MILLGLDPSSTRTGYALVTLKGGALTVLEAGYLKPAMSTEKPMRRIGAMVDDLMRLIEEHKPDIAIVEVCSGHVGVGQRRNAGARLGVYGMAVGAMYQAVRSVPGLQAEWVNEDVWPQGVPKRQRQQDIAMMFPAYAEQIDADGGADVSDAIGISLWWWFNIVQTGAGVG